MRAAAAWAVLAVAAAAPGQGPDRPERHRQAGFLTGRSGAAWGGADVFFLSREIPWLAGVGESDLVRVRTDRRGRFRAMLLAGRTYSVWALDPSGRRGSVVVEDVLAGRPLRLTEGEPLRRPRVRITGIESWDPWGPLRYRVVTLTKNVVVEDIGPGGDGRLGLPRLPGPGVVVEARTRDGRPIASRRISVARGGPDPVLDLPLPYPVLVHAGSTDGRPVSAATVLVESRGRWYPQGRTDRGGLCRIVWPLPRGRDGEPPQRVRLRILVAAPGFGERLFHRDVDPRRDRTPRITADLDPVPSIRGRLLLTRGRPLGHHPILYEAPLSAGNGSWTSPRFPRLVFTEPDGSFRIPAPGIAARFPVPVQFRLSTLAPAGLPAVAVPIVLRTATAAAGTGPDRHDLGDIVLTAFEGVHVTVTRADGVPVRHGRVLFARRGSVGLTTGRRVEYRTTRRGALSLLLPEGEYTIGAVDGRALAVRSFDVPREPGRGRELVLALSRPVPVRGRVVDTEGRGLAGARVRWSHDWRRVDRVRQTLLAVLEEQPATTAADGAFELLLPEGEATYYLWATHVAGGHRHDSAQTVVHAGRHGATEVDIVISAPPAPGK